MAMNSDTKTTLQVRKPTFSAIQFKHMQGKSKLPYAQKDLDKREDNASMELQVTTWSKDHLISESQMLYKIPE